MDYFYVIMQVNMLKSVYICKRKQNRVVFSVQKVASTKSRFRTDLPQSELCCCVVRPELVCPCPTDRTPFVSVPYVTMTHEGRYPCLADMHVKGVTSIFLGLFYAT